MRHVKRSASAVLCLISVPIFAQITESSFAGTWDLVSIEARTDAGDWVPYAIPGGGTPVGVLMYDDLGNMAVQITAEPRSTETPAEQPEMINGYVAYYATYEVDSVAGTITHHRRNHINADLANLSVVRYFRFSGDTLTLTVAPDRRLRLNWKRVQ